ncbi:MAG: hypothetical protein LBL01_02770, partial [Bifidobacteriaceae bacterium]|nr:hypothetical protein [Bifidobacteriaceae bacterium]
TLVIGGASEPADQPATAALVARVEELTAGGERLKDAVALVAGAAGPGAPGRTALYQAVLVSRTP